MKDDAQKMTAVLVIAVATVILMVINSVQIFGLGAGEGFPEMRGSSGAIIDMPSGTPRIYGEELGISYDDVSASNQQKADLVINKMGALDRSIILNAEQKTRYIDVLYNMNNGISCEYCCGARAIIFSNGEPACGCAHSYAMRGIAKYIITKHGSEFTDTQILEEMSKWKMLFFPTQMSAKAQIMKDAGLDVDYISLGSNQYRGIESQAQGSVSGGMVGGC